MLQTFSLTAYARAKNTCWLSFSNEIIYDLFGNIWIKKKIKSLVCFCSKIVSRPQIFTYKMVTRHCIGLRLKRHHNAIQDPKHTMILPIQKKYKDR